MFQNSCPDGNRSVAAFSRCGRSTREKRFFTHAVAILAE